MDQSYQVDTLNQAIWVSKNFAPYGTELVKIGLDSDGKLSSVMAKDIASGTNSGMTSSKSGSGQIDGAVLPDGVITAGIFIIRWIVQYIIFAICFKKLGEYDLIPSIWLFDIYTLIYNIRMLPALFTSNKEWR
jgi:hypothetical protein